MLSVSGLRGIVDQSLTEAVARRYGQAFGQWLGATSQLDQPHVVVGRDSRPSGERFAPAVAQGLAEAGCRVTLVGICSTPGVGIMIDHHQAQGGMVITASHNPIQWNGIKALRHDGLAPPPDQAQQIIDRFGALATSPDEGQGSSATAAPIEHDESGPQTHVQRVLAQVPQLPLESQKPLRVVVDPVNGAGGPEAKLLLSALGCEARFINLDPSGEFAHTPEPTAANLGDLCQAVIDQGADIGFAQDPDADRLAIVDQQGRYIGEEYTLVLAARQVLETAGDSSACIVANLSTSRMIDDLVRRYGATVRRSPVGEANVVAVMQQCEALIGGEGNGGVIWPVVGNIRNSLVGMALVLQLMARTGQSIGQLVSDLPAYHIVKQKMPIEADQAQPIIDTVAKAFGDRQIDRQDGLRVDMDHGWFHLRPSNTEPIMRLIAEAPTAAEADALIDQARAAMPAAQ
jgi:phosphomannomutase